MKTAPNTSLPRTLWNWFVGVFTGRNKAVSLYRQGMAKAKRHDHQGAIADYTATLDVASTPEDVRAMVLYNRALVYMASGENSRGMEDMEAVIAMKQAPAHIKTEARRRLARKPHGPATNV